MDGTVFVDTNLSPCYPYSIYIAVSEFEIAYHRGKYYMTYRLPLFYIVCIFFWMALYAYVPYVTPYAEQMDADLRLIGLIAGAYGFVQMVIRFPLGIFSDKVQKRKIFVLIGLFFAALGGLVVYFFSHPVALLVSRSFGGVTAATWVTFTILGASYYKQEDTIKSIGVLNAANGFGRMTALFLGGLVAEWMGFSYAFLLAGVFGIVGLILGFWMVEKKPEAGADGSSSNAPSFTDLLDVAKNRQLLTASILAILSQYIMFATTFGFTPMVATGMGASNVQLGLLGMVSTLPALLVSPFMAGVVKKTGIAVALAVLFTFSGVGTILVAFCDNLVQLFAAQILSAVGLAGLMTILMGLSIRDIDAERRAAAMGFFQAVYGLGMFLGPFVVGLTGHGVGLMPAFIVTGMIGIVGAIASVICVNKKYLI